MTFWHDEAKVAKYGCQPYLEVDELYAQGRDIERNKRSRATRMFEQDLKQCGDDIDKIIELTNGVDYFLWATARKVKAEQKG